MNNSAKKLLKVFLIIAIFPVVIGLYFFDNVKGYYKFKDYCAKDGGFKVYDKFIKNVGWMANDKFDAMSVSHLKYVGFSRYPEIKEDGKFYDLIFKGGNPSSLKSHIISPADRNKYIKYKWKVINMVVVNELRLEKYGYEVLDSENGYLVARYYSFGYSVFNRNATLLGAPSGIGCFNEPGLWKRDLDKNFISNLKGERNVYFK